MLLSLVYFAVCRLLAALLPRTVTMPLGTSSSGPPPPAQGAESAGEVSSADGTRNLHEHWARAMSVDARPIFPQPPWGS